MTQSGAAKMHQGQLHPGILNIWQCNSDPPATAHFVLITYKSLLVCWLQQTQKIDCNGGQTYQSK